MSKCVVLVCLLLGACGDDGVKHQPDAPVSADAPPDAAVCAPVTGTGTMHGGSVNTEETWTAAGSPYLLPFDTEIYAKLTIEKCAVVRLGANKTLTVRPAGSLIAAGAPGQRVRFERLAPNDSWAVIRTLGGMMSMTSTDVVGGGDPLNGTALLTGAIELTGPTTTTTGVLHAVDLKIEGSDSNGFLLHDGGGFDATSDNVTVTGAATSPIYTFARLMGTIPPGHYTGNGLDEIRIRGGGGTESVQEDVTLHERGVPYRIGIQINAVLDVASNVSGGLAKLTIEPGVTLRFEPGATVRIDPGTGTAAARGALIAVGTAAKPIVFTSASATPAAGDWYGIWFGGVPVPASRIDFARVEYAGQASVTGSGSCTLPNMVGQNDAGIRIYGEPSTQFITNTTILASARMGIDRGFRSDTKPDFLATNTFTQVPGCKQTYPRDINGACPTVIPCP